MTTALQLLMTWLSKIILSLSLLFWSLVLVIFLYSLIWLLVDKSHDVRTIVDDPFAVTFTALIASLFLKLSWDGLTSWRMMQKKYLAIYTRHANEGKIR